MNIKYKNLILYVLRVVLLAVVYHLAARLGLQMAYVQANTSPVWPPSGIGLAALLLLGTRYWPGVTLGVVAGSLITGAPVGLALGLGLANTLEAIVGALLLTRWVQFNPRMETIRDVIGLAGTAAVSTSVSASLGVLVLRVIMNVSQPPFFTLWVTWWVGNLLGVLVITPLILVWVKYFTAAKKRSKIVEGIIFITLLTVVTVYVFETSSDESIFHQALIYLIFPFAIWAALRLEQIGAVTTVIVVSGIAIWGTVRGYGPFSQLPLNESLIILQTFTGVVALTSLTLAATASERKNAERKLQRRVEDLAALNDSSKEFLSNLDKSALYTSICRLVVERLGLSAAWIELVNAGKAKDDFISEVASEYYSKRINPYGSAGLFASHMVKKVIQEVQSTGETAVINHLNTSPEPLSGVRPGQDISFASFPLAYSGKVIGVLCVISENSNGFSKEQILLLESYANLAVVAIQNSWLFEQVLLGNEQLHALSHRLMNLQELERIHLSRELHDETGQILAALMVRLGLIERDAKTPALFDEHIPELKRIVNEVLNNLHNMAVKLRPASLDHLGLITALTQYLQDYSKQYNLKVQFDAEDIKNQRLPKEIETALYRIVQESLTNVALHAQASNVDILINHRNDSLVMTIEDDGVGFNPIPMSDENRLGLFGMRERVEMLGGKFLVESSPGKGTTIVVEVPYELSRIDR